MNNTNNNNLKPVKKESAFSDFNHEIQRAVNLEKKGTVVDDSNYTSRYKNHDIWVGFEIGLKVFLIDFILLIGYFLTPKYYLKVFSLLTGVVIMVLYLFIYNKYVGKYRFATKRIKNFVYGLLSSGIFFLLTLSGYLYLIYDKSMTPKIHKFIQGIYNWFSFSSATQKFIFAPLTRMLRIFNLRHHESIIIEILAFDIFMLVVIFAIMFVSDKEIKSDKDIDDITLKKSSSEQQEYFHSSKFDIRNTLITGSTGSGKTQLLNRFISSRMKQPGKFIFYDLDGDFLKTFYRQGDIILNIMDARSHCWNFLSEMKNPAIIRQMSHYLIPPNPKESQPFFRNEARNILEDKLLSLFNQGKTTNQDILIALKQVDKKINADVLTTYNQEIRHLLFFNTTGEVFNLHDWLFKPDEKRNIFLTYNKDYEDEEKPFLSLFTAMLNNYILSSDFTDNKTRINIIIDELTNIAKIDNLDGTLSLCRHKNVAFFLSTQSPMTMQGLYDDAFYGIMENTNNKYHFRSSEKESAQLIADSFGEKEVRETLTSTSNPTGDGFLGGASGTTENIRKTKNVFSNDILNLKDLQYYGRYLTDNGIKQLKGLISFIPARALDIKAFVERTVWNLPETQEQGQDNTSDDDFIQQENEEQKAGPDKNIDIDEKTEKSEAEAAKEAIKEFVSSKVKID